MRHVNCIFVVCVLFFFIPMVPLAGSLDDPGGPTDPLSAMYTITDVYNRINDGTAGTKRTTTFGEPSGAPGSTGKTLNDLYGLASERSRPAKTGQSLCYDSSGTSITCTGTGQDGDKLKGVNRPNPRFTTATDTVTDNLTGLIWSKNANLAGTTKTWSEALSYCNDLSLGGYTDWRLPNLRELLSLIDYGNVNPALPNDYGTYFNSLQSSYYWSSTTSANVPANAWAVYLLTGSPGAIAKGGSTPPQYYIWPVRGGQ